MSGDKKTSVRENEQTPLVSVVIPCYNGGAYLREAIASVEKCDRSRYELIIVNDGSTDDLTKRVLGELAFRGYKIIHQENKGVGAARNTGIRAARGKYILPLDADDRIRECFIPMAVGVLEEFPEVGVVYGDAEFFEMRAGKWTIPEFDLEKLLLHNYIYASAIFRKALWLDCGGYDTEPSIQIWADWDFWLSAAERNWKFRHLKETVFEYRIRRDSMSFEHREAAKSPAWVEDYMVRKHPRLYKKMYDEVYYAASWYYHWQKNPLRGAAKLLLRSLLRLPEKSQWSAADLIKLKKSLDE